MIRLCAPAMSLLLLSVVALSAGDPAKKEEARNKEELKRFEGSWRVLHHEAYGEQPKKDDIEKMEVVFKGTQLIIKNPKAGKDETFTLKIDAAKRHMDVTGVVERKGKKEKDKVEVTSETMGTFLGIYAFDNGKLKICLTGPEVDRGGKKTALTRPTEFRSSEKDRTVLVVLERK